MSKNAKLSHSLKSKFLILGLLCSTPLLSMDLPPQEPPHYKNIENVSEIEGMVRPGDWVILDIDETILKVGYNGNPRGEKGVLNLDPKIPDLIKNWQQSYPASEGKKQIRLIFLTARSDDPARTYKELQEAGFPEGIEVIFAPNDKTSGIKQSTKGKILAAKIQEEPPENRPNRIIVVDDLTENLDSIGEALYPVHYFTTNTGKVKKNLILLKKKLNYKIYGDETIFPDDLNTLILGEHLRGGSGGVNILTSPETGKKYTFKCVSDPKQMKEEIVADALYRSLGIHVPNFAVYDYAPKGLEQQCTGPGPFRLAEFIDSNKTIQNNEMSRQKTAEKLRENFVADAFFSNWDIVILDDTLHHTYKNVIMDDNNNLWRIDNGGSLRYRALGEPKTTVPGWNPFKVTDLESMVNPAINRHGSLTYAGLTEDNLKQQAQDILNKREGLFKALDEISEIVHLEKPHQVKEMLRRRLDDLVNRFNLTTPIPEPLKSEKEHKKRPDLAKTIYPATEKSAAGVLIYSIDPKTSQPMVLLGQRIGHKWWGDFGGKSDVITSRINDLDKTLADTAVREVKEESNGLLSFTPMELSKFPSHQFINEDQVLYRMYMAPYRYFDIKELNKPENPLHKDRYNWSKEHGDYAWVPLSVLMEGIPVIEENQETKKIILDGKEFILYPPFLKMLEQPQIQEIITLLSKGKNLPARHTQQDLTTTISPISLDEEQQQLAETVVRKGKVMGEFKKKFGEKSSNEASDLEKIKTMKGFIPDDAADRLRKDLKKTPYTQTQGYLAHVMGEKIFASLGNNTLAEINTFLKKYSKKSDKMTNADPHFIKILVEALNTEKLPENLDKIVFYHATDPFTSFLFDVYSAYRSHLKTLAPDDLKAFRGIETSFHSILDVEAFINTFKDSSGNINNYAEKDGLKFADMGLSVNPFLFGNDGIEASDTYYMFYTLITQHDPDHEKIFNDFMAATGIPGKFKDYVALYEQYYRIHKLENSKLYQIFIDPQVVDTVSYTCVILGQLVTTYLNGEVPYTGFAHIMEKERSAGTEFTNLLSKAKSVSEVNFNNLQGRLYLKPEIFHNPKFVKIKSYWRYEVPKDIEKSYDLKLNALVSQDLSTWLSQHVSGKKNIFFEGTPRLQQLYKQVYEGQTGLKYTQLEGINLLPMAIANGDIEVIKRILNNSPEIKLSQIIPNTKYSKASNEPAKIHLISFLHEGVNNFNEILDLFLEHCNNYKDILQHAILDKWKIETFDKILSSKKDWSAEDFVDCKSINDYGYVDNSTLIHFAIMKNRTEVANKLIDIDFNWIKYTSTHKEPYITKEYSLVDDALRAENSYILDNLLIKLPINELTNLKLQGPKEESILNSAVSSQANPSIINSLLNANDWFERISLRENILKKIGEYDLNAGYVDYVGKKKPTIHDQDKALKEIYDKFIKYTSNDYFPLKQSIENLNIDVLKLLLKYKEDIIDDNFIEIPVENSSIRFLHYIPNTKRDFYVFSNNLLEFGQKTILHTAIDTKNFEIVTLLLESKYGKLVNKIIKNDKQLAKSILISAFNSSDLHIINLILDQNYEIDDLEFKKLGMFGPLNTNLLNQAIKISNIEIVNRLLKSDYKKLIDDILKNNTDLTQSPLTYALMSRNMEIIKLFTSTDYNFINSENYYYYLREAIYSGDILVLNYILNLNFILSNLIDDKNQTILHNALETRNTKIVNTILNSKYNDQLNTILNSDESLAKSLLYLTMQSGNVDIVKTILNQNYNINDLIFKNQDYIYSDETTILHTAIETANLEIVKLMLSSQKYNPLVQMVLETKYDPAHSLLNSAIKSKNPEIVKIFIDKKYNILNKENYNFFLDESKHMLASSFQPGSVGFLQNSADYHNSLDILSLIRSVEASGELN